ncbi:acetylornithine deacetylase [Modicisalibacter ilicicola DSM 19980]|uniref:Acetylornithine deacetylase n=1 Tax=Modicisalibacter ilicicola DSM 19980 TaxID=1121942 RepID=A0A1M4YH24_9GAMM|nr:ArgE/DapE family deacylase [Halomonas ilicicola]SHF04822.1 acetylornithine deacetylase [Halomonas ilicicola DSM 19980]
MLDATEKTILERCEALMDDTLALTRDLVRGYSVLGQEQGALSTMEHWFERLNLPVERVPLDAPGFDRHPHRAPVPWSSKERYNLVSRLNPNADKPHLVLNGHLDVVPAEPTDMWTRSPWEPWEQDGWLYGRGAGDMKAGIAAMVMAVQAVREAGVDIDFPLTLQTVIEEECSGNGALACLHQGYGGDFVLIPEPFGAQIYTGQIGVLWFRIRVNGVPAHVLDTTSGNNAIETLHSYLPALKALEEALNAPPRPSPYDTHDHPFNLSIGKIEGGNWASSVPAHAILEGRIGFPPGLPPEEVMTRLRRVVAEHHGTMNDGTPAPTIDFHGFRSEGHLVDLETSGIRLLSRCHEDLVGAPPAHYLSTCTTDLRAFHVEGGINGTCYGPVAQRIHGVDECVEIDSIRQVLTTYALFISRWATDATKEIAS